MGDCIVVSPPVGLSVGYVRWPRSVHKDHSFVEEGSVLSQRVEVPEQGERGLLAGRRGRLVEQIDRSRVISGEVEEGAKPQAPALVVPRRPDNAKSEKGR